MNKKNRMLRVRFTDSEYSKLKQVSEDADMSMSELVRDNASKKTVRNRNDEKQRIAMLNRINANLNMIARWVNTYKSGAEAVQVIAHLSAIERAIEEKIKE